MYVFVYACCVYEYMHACMRQCIYTFIQNEALHVCMHACTYVYKYVCMYVFVYVACKKLATTKNIIPKKKCDTGTGPLDGLFLQ